MEYRIEHDSMGEVKVPADKYWAAQTERSHENFPIGVGLETMPREITHAFGILKQAAARANHALKPEKMTAEKLTVIEQACQEVQRETPMGAYAVEYLTYTVDETPRNYDAIQLTVGYRRTAAQVAGIVHITSTSALGDLLREAARNHAAELVVQVGYFDHQAEEVRTQVTQIQAEVEPESKEPWTVNFYPDSGNAGIIEVLLSGAGSAEGAEQNTKNTN